MNVAMCGAVFTQQRPAVGSSDVGHGAPPASCSQPTHSSPTVHQQQSASSSSLSDKGTCSHPDILVAYSFHPSLFSFFSSPSLLSLLPTFLSSRHLSSPLPPSLFFSFPPFPSSLLPSFPIHFIALIQVFFDVRLSKMYAAVYKSVRFLVHV